MAAPPSAAATSHARAVRLLDLAQLLCGALALGLFVLVLGWPLPDVVVVVRLRPPDHGSSCSCWAGRCRRRPRRRRRA